MRILDDKKLKRNKANRKFWIWGTCVIIIVAPVFFYYYPLRQADIIGSTNKDNVIEIDSVSIKNASLFNSDSAFSFCEKQCSFGPRVMNTPAHDACGDYIANKYKEYGCTVIEQPCELKAFDGTILKSRNIIASIHPQAETRILLCAHWDSRPWADNDPIKSNRKKPVMGANDGASGVAVMIEIARTLTLIAKIDSSLLPADFGIDFICIDAEDFGIDEDESSWALGAQYWAKNPHIESYRAEFGILLDMVGGKDAHFYREQLSDHYASWVVDNVWELATTIGNDAYFINAPGAIVTDDHKPINEIMGIPTIDIISYYPNCQQSGFGPTWHTTHDTMDAIDRNVLRAVGGTLIVVLLQQAAQHAQSSYLQDR